MLSISTRTMSSAIGLLVCLLFVAAARAQDILVFGDIGLPDCAHSCVDLYSAQYDCQNVVNSVACFCGNSFITTKPKGWRCDEVCTTEGEREKVAAFLATTCGSWADVKVEGKVDRKDNGTAVPSSTNSSTPATPTVVVTPTGESAGNEPEPTKATNWPRKNWPYVLGVFLFIAISALAFIFAGPLRKYFRRQITKRHIHKSGEGSPHYRAPSTSHPSRISFEYPPLPPPLDSGAPSSHGGSAASGLPLQGRVDVERNRPHKPMRPPTVVLDTPPPIRTLFATRVATESSNHETWGQRMRRRCKEGLGFFGKASRLAFRRRSGSEEKGSGNVV